VDTLKYVHAPRQQATLHVHGAREQKKKIKKLKPSQLEQQ
jgi:hypothetical protein